MRKIRLLLTMLLAVVAWGKAAAETVSPYLADFENPINTAVRDFAVASNWRHIVGIGDYDGNGPYYMGYSYSSSDGIDGSHTLIAYRQYAGDYGGGEVVEDVLVTPVISGEVKMFVKVSGLASTSYPSFVEFYNVDQNGTTLGEQIQRFTATEYVESEIEGWSTITINLDSPKRIGIRAQYVYMDNFSATSAELVKEAKLTIGNVTSPTGSTPVYYSQKEDGTVDINVKVKLKNEGEVNLVAGETENYSLSLVKGAYYGSNNTVYDNVKFDIPVDLAIGEETEVDAVFNAPADFGTGWFYVKVKENITGSISSAKVQAQVMEYASKFIFDVAGSEYYTSPSATRTPISFGKILEATTLYYEIYNAGTAPLVINSFTLPAPFTSDAPAGEFTVAGGEKKQIAITLPADEFGIFSGELTIEYTNFGKEMATYTLGISGTVLDPSKNVFTFDNGTNGQFPAGSIHSDQVYISSSTTGDVTNWYLQSTNTTTKFITPLMTAEAGEAFTYDTWYYAYNSSNAAVTVYTSKDRVNWTQVDRQTYYTGIGNAVTTYAVTLPEAGNYYLAFELQGNALLDNIYGLALAETPAHDWYLIGSDIPTSGKQNFDYTASVQVQNISAVADQVETATLYVNGEAIATVEGTELAGNEKTAAVGTGRNGYSNIEDPTTISFTFKPHAFGTFPTYIELKSGDSVLKTEVVNVNFEEEVASSEIVVGTPNGTSNKVPFYGFDMEQGAYADFYFSKAQLETFGIKKDDVITAIKFKGTVSSKTIDKLKAEAWVGLEADGSFEPGNVSKDDMTHVVIYDDEKVEFSSPVEMTIDLSSSPITYDGESEIRIYTSMNGNGQYISVSWEKDANYPQQAYYSKDETTWTSYSFEPCPVGYFTLAIENKTLSGMVTEADGTTPVAGATVTIRNDENDIEYFGTTDETGAYSINVVQEGLTFTATVTAAGYETLEDTDVLDFSNGSVVKNFTLVKAESDFALGDVNHDGNIDVKDVMAVVAYILGQQTGVFFIENANLDGNEEVDVNDVMGIVNIILFGQ